MSSAVFTPDLGHGGLPDIGLSMVLAALGARRTREHGPDDPVGQFVTALGAAVRRGPGGEVSGRADASGLDYAARLMVGQLLEDAVLPTRADSVDTAKVLALLVGQWATFARA